jgi:Transposase DDE domain/Transposase domain (DUF772)
MFKQNKKYLQNNLFGLSDSLTENLQKEIQESEFQKFYELIFLNIREEDFECLYSEIGSRPNAPINVLVSSIILMHRYKWTYEQMFQQIKFNLLVKTALGLNTINEVPFSEATMFNFLSRINNHFITTGENLLEKVFDTLTEKQIKELKIKTDIQRTDSFQAASNIRRYSRLQLLIEMLIRIYRVLNEEDQLKYKDIFTKYISKTSGQYIYKLQSENISDELDNVARLYHYTYNEIKPGYEGFEIFKIFERVYFEHFAVEKEKIMVKTSEEINSSSLQSPDDIDATYSRKYNKTNIGQNINIVETANPENELNLITDVAINANNIDDSVVINERLEKIKDKTQDLNEIHFDGAYGSLTNDEKCSEENLKIKQIQTGIRGRESKSVEIEITEISNEQTKSNKNNIDIDYVEYKVSCPNQEVKSQKSRKRNMAIFDTKICSKCEFAEKCKIEKYKKGRVYYFYREEYLKKQRYKNIESIPKERRTLRSNVEATVSEFKRKMQNGKLRVRGKFKASLFGFSMAISINFGRIYRFVNKKLLPEKGELGYTLVPK